MCECVHISLILADPSSVKRDRGTYVIPVTWRMVEVPCCVVRAASNAVWSLQPIRGFARKQGSGEGVCAFGRRLHVARPLCMHASAIFCTLTFTARTRRSLIRSSHAMPDLLRRAVSLGLYPASPIRPGSAHPAEPAHAATPCSTARLGHLGSRAMRVTACNGGSHARLLVGECGDAGQHFTLEKFE